MFQFFLIISFYIGNVYGRICHISHVYTFASITQNNPVDKGIPEQALCALPNTLFVVLI